jgi:hypothetical protein
MHANDRHKNPGYRRIFAKFLVFHNVPEDTRTGLVLSLTSYRASHAADAFFKVYNHAVSHF